MVSASCPVVVGRDGERAALATSLQAAADRRGATTALLGEPGTGKTRLVRDLAEQAKAGGMAVLAGRVADGVPCPPFRPLVEALLAGLRARPVPDATGLAPFRPALGRLLPPLRTGDPGPAEEPTPVLAEGVLRLLRELAGSNGLLLVLEDMHRADVETLAVLEYLADNLAGEAIFTVITLRPETDTEGLVLTRRLQARGTVATIVLDPLDEAAVSQLVRAYLDSQVVPEGLLEWLATLAEGVPFLVEELLAGAISSGALRRGPAGWSFSPLGRPVVPGRFADSVRRRADSVDDAAGWAVRCAAVLGRVFDARLLPGLAGQERTAVAASLRRAVELQLVTPHDGDQGTHRFRHALSRQVLLDDLPGYQRREIAGTALKIVQQARPQLPGSWCDLAAHLAEQAGDHRRAAALLLERGRRAADVGALATARHALERARGHAVTDEPTLVRIETLLLRVLGQAGAPERAREVGQRLLGVLDRISAPASERADVELSLARAAAHATDWERAGEHIALARAAASGDAAATARADASGAFVAIGQERGEDAATLAGRALREATSVGLAEPGMADVACEAYEVLGRAARTRDLAAADSAFTGALQVAERHELPHRQLQALHQLGTLDLLDSLRTERLVGARRLAQDSGSLVTATSIELNLAAVLTLQLRLDEALEAATRCERLARQFSIGGVAPMALATQAAIHALALRRADMEAAITAALACPDVDDNVVAGLWGQARAEYSLGCEDRDRALVELDTAMGHLRGRGGSPWPLRGMWAMLRSLEGAGGAAARMEVAGAPWGQTRIMRAQLRYADAIAAGRDKDPERAVAAFTAAEREMSRLSGTEWLRHRARRLVAEAAISDGWGEPVSWLRPALDAFTHSGHRQLATACRSLLRRLGESVPRGRSSYVPESLYQAGVTAREMDVLRLLGEQLPNVDIARRLVISPRTVEKHVERLLAKTARASRHELAELAALHRHTHGEDT